MRWCQLDVTIGSCSDYCQLEVTIGSCSDYCQLEVTIGSCLLLLSVGGDHWEL